MQKVQNLDDFKTFHQYGPLIICPGTRKTSHVGNMSRVIALTNPNRILTASDDGKVCLWDMKLNLIKTLQLQSSVHGKTEKLCVRDLALQLQSSVHGKSEIIHVRDIALMHNVQLYVVATKVIIDIAFYDALVCLEVFNSLLLSN